MCDVRWRPTILRGGIIPTRRTMRSVVGKWDMMMLAVLSLVHKRDVYRKGSSVGWWRDR